MGCDIHFHVEKRTAEGWVRAEPIKKNRWHGCWADEPEFTHADFYDGRNYSLFAMLAGVRNYTDLEPISEPRCLPVDASDEVKRECEQWGPDGHTHSYLTLAELLAVPWHEWVGNHTGWVSADDYEQWRRWRRGEGLGPLQYSGGVSGPRVKHVSNEEMDRLLDTGALGSEWSYYTRVEWVESWAVSVGDFMSTLVRMAGIASTDGLPLADVRAVFWFDN